MLVLTRRVGEEIVIADNIRVTVVVIKGGRVKIGVTAPPEVKVLREEVQGRPRPQPVGGAGLPACGEVGV